MKWEFDFRLVRKQIRALPKEAAMDILRALTGRTDRCQLRVRSYRVVDDVIDDKVVVRLVSVGHRKKAYRSM